MSQRVTLDWPQALVQSVNLQNAHPSPQSNVSADGRRFLTIAPLEQGAEAARPKIRVVLHWHEEFRDRKQD